MIYKMAYFPTTFVYICIVVFTLQIVHTTAARTFQIDFTNNTFIKDGKPFRYISGSMHYSRIHQDYWKDRLQKMKAAGLNAVQTYVPWNVHELEPGVFYWEGMSDLEKFIQLAQESDLVVLLRLGPYICGEWEFGGFPAWLLTVEPNMVLRTSDYAYLKWVDKWFTVLLKKIKPYLYENGGPIIMVQVENEYGSYFACDSVYLDFLVYKVKSELGPNVTLYTTDGCGLGYLRCGKVNGSYATVDFGPGSDPTGCFGAQRFYEPNGPFINSEYYTGWLDHWGSPHAKVDTNSVSKSLDRLLEMGANVNMYMFIGGTNFGFMNGANSPPYEPVPTSYDYGGPLTEAGDITPKYYAVRDIISKYQKLPDMPIPPNTNKTKYGNISLEFISTVQDALPYLAPAGPKLSTYPVPMEQINFYAGFIMYRFVLSSNFVNPTPLYSKGIRDRAVVMVNGVPFGLMDRTMTTVNITGSIGQAVDILVENQGRIGYGKDINFNNKGIVSNVTLNNVIVTGWQIYPLNVDNIPNVTFSSPSKRSQPSKSQDGQLLTPSIYAGSVNIPNTPDQPQDTYLDPRPFVKGQAFVNSFNIGRYWPTKGPQVTLYIPKQAFNNPPALNLLYLFELENAPCLQVPTCQVFLTDTPNIDGPNGPGTKSSFYTYPRRYH
ncbi:beta-galactosidase-like [Physella acuta]|uniref:beta-galactosidase-like n=1 Tax=Physella acuta TaxID=109671 RepID=UPI0027DD712A|nr:beta-galactosidase-like [Physella acuta]